MENLLIRGLTEEEQQMLKELQIKDARAEATLEAVDKIAAEGIISAEKACELLEGSLEDYKKWKAERKA